MSSTDKRPSGRVCRCGCGRPAVALRGVLDFASNECKAQASRRAALADGERRSRLEGASAPLADEEDEVRDTPSVSPNQGDRPQEATVRARLGLDREVTS
jgi:hypothetical protein